jgi:hypothetical protein
VYLRDTFAIVSYTPSWVVEATRLKNKTEKYPSEPEPEISFLAHGPTPWEARELIWGWLEPKMEDGVDPWDVVIVSCDVIWDPFELVDCGDEEFHNGDNSDDYFHHRYCGTTGSDRVDYVAEMISYNEEYLGDVDNAADAAHRMGWTVAELLGNEEAYPGVDYFNVRYGPYPKWEASLYGGILVKEAS